MFMGVASLFGLTQGIEWLLWLLIAVCSAIVIAARERTRRFGTGFLAGLLDGIGNSIVQFFFFDVYLRNNPQVSGTFDQIPAGPDPALLVLLSGAFIGLLYGVSVGLLSLLAGKVMRKPPAQPPGP
jgi:hypothetical protein